MALNFGAGSLFKTSEEDNQVLFSQGNQRFPGSVVRTIAVGTKTIAATTTAYDIDFVDIPFVKNTLSVNDILQIAVNGFNDGTQTFTMRMDADATTSNSATGDLLSWAAGTLNGLQLSLYQGVGSRNDDIQFWYIRATAADIIPIATLSTGDADIFPTAWTLRLNFKYAANGTTASTIRYSVLVYKA